MNVEKGERFAMANENRSKQKKKKKEFGSFLCSIFLRLRLDLNNC